VDAPIVLTGFMGVGKSATGRSLARLLGWEFLDLDEAIEAEAGKSVARIFAEDGERHFRKLEHEVLNRVLRRSRIVVAAGGGVLVREENRVLLKGQRVVNLEASPGECLRRMEGSGTARPLLAGGDAERLAHELYESRRAFYAAVPLRVDTQGKSPEEVAREIVQRLEAEEEAASESHP
jgi:shikimate kinase